MAFAKKTWTDRMAEFINRRTLTKEDGSTEIVTVARSEGTISQEGDAFNAKTMNDLEQRIADEFASQKETLANINTNLTADDNTPFRFGVNENGEYGYIITDSEGADTVIPFKKGANLELITHTSTSESGNYRYNHYDLTSYEGYENFTEDNFLPIITNISYCSAGGTDRVYSVKPTLQYDKTTGILKYISRANTRGVCDCYYSVNMYLLR